MDAIAMELPRLLWMASNDPTALLTFGLAAIGLGIFCGYKGLTAVRRGREVETVPLSLAALIGPNGPSLVAVQGVARGTAISRAPVSSTPCVYWETILYQYENQGRDYEEVTRDTFCGSEDEIEVEDASGKIPVIVTGADFEIDEDLYCSNGTTMGLPDAGVTWVTQKGFDWRQTSPVTPLRVRERRIAEGSPVYVLGTAAPAPSDLAAVNPSNYLIGAGDDNSDFIIGIAPKALTERRMVDDAVLWTFVAVALLFIGILVITGVLP